MLDIILGLNFVIGVADEEVFAVTTDPRQLIMRDDNRGSIATTCTSIGPHPFLLIMRTAILSIPLGRSKFNSQIKTK